MVCCRANERRLIKASGSLKDPSKTGVHYFLVNIIIIYLFIYIYLKKVQHVHQNCPPVKYIIKTNWGQIYAQSDSLLLLTGAAIS